MTVSRRDVLTRTGPGAVLGAATFAAASLATPARAAGAIEWKMVTSWPKNLPGPGVTAQKLADLIATLSAGRLTVKLYAAGELVPPLEVFSAVSTGTAEIAHTAPLFWAGKMAAAPIFTAAPFGLTPLEHITWITRGGGQELWDELYRPHGIKPFMASNTGYQMGGWFRNELRSVADFQGLKMRMPGLGGLVIQQLGAVPVALAPGDIFTSLQSGVIDATEFLGPFSDSAMGFQKVAKNYYYPGFHEPNGTGEALVSIEALEALPADLQAVVATACEWVNLWSLADAEWENARALKHLQAEDGVTLRRYPSDVLAAARKATESVMADLAGKDDLTGRIVDSYRGAATHLGEWSDVSVKAFLGARGAA
ncbi:MAG: TRAP transporter substrate-binding protein [Nitratireductor sp.]|nr:TRAP transporter substrate-binding protein [Nitratireductor sp.]